MPILPDMGQAELPVPQSGGGTVGYQPGKSSLSVVGKGMTEIGKIVKLQQHEDDVFAAEGSFNQVRQAQIDLAAGPDGFLNKKGEQALDGKLHEQYLGRFDKTVNDISGKLVNDEQRKLLKQRADISRIQLSENLLQHAMQQDEVVTKERYQGTLEVEEKTAVMNAYNPPAVALSILRVQNAVDTVAKKQDWPKEYADTQKAKATSQIHASVIESMIMDGHDMDAQTYYKHVKDSLDPATNKRIQPKLESATTDGKAFRAVDEIWQQKGPKGINDPVKTFDMEAVVRDKFKDDPSAQKAAIAEIRSRAQSFNAQQQEVTNSNISEVLKNFDAGMTPMSVRKTREFQELNGKDQDTIINHMNAITKTDKDALTPESAQMVDAIKGLSISDPVAFSNLNVGTLVGKIPNAQVQNVIDMKVNVERTADRAARVNTYLSDRSIRAVLDSADVTRPGKKPDGDDYNAFVSKFSDGIEQFQQEYKRAPKPEEARKIAAQLTSSVFLYKEHWWNKSMAKVYELGDEKLAKPISWEQIKSLPKGTPFIHFQDGKPYTKK